MHRRSNRKEYAWETVDLITIGGTAYAYQQKFEVKKEEEKKSKKRSGYQSMGFGLGLGVGLTMVPKDEHRLKAMKETLNKESVKKATQEWNND